MNRKSKFGLGVILGAAAGAVAGLFLAPKSGKENRKMVSKKIAEIRKIIEEKEVDKKVKQIFGDSSKASQELFLKTKDEMADRLGKLNVALSAVDRTKYTKMVSNVVERVKENKDLPENTWDNLKKYLSEDFKKIQEKYKRAKIISKPKVQNSKLRAKLKTKKTTAAIKKSAKK